MINFLIVSVLHYFVTLHLYRDFTTICLSSHRLNMFLSLSNFPSDMLSHTAQEILENSDDLYSDASPATPADSPFSDSCVNNTTWLQSTNVTLCLHPWYIFQGYFRCSLTHHSFWKEIKYSHKTEHFLICRRNEI